MSYIHEALKKAQKKRDDHYQGYGEILSAQGKKTISLSGKRVLWVFLVLFVIFLAFVSYSWLDFGAKQIPAVSQNEYEKPIATPPPQGIIDSREFYERARRYQKHGFLHDARRLYQEVLRVDPGYVEALNNLGVIFIYEKDYKGAQSNFEKAIRLNPAYVDSYYNLACLNAIKGEVRKGLAYLKKAISLDQAVKGWAMTDTDLKNLRKAPEFEKMIKD